MIAALLVVAACNSAPGVSEITDAEAASLTVDAMIRACEDECSRLDIYVRDVLTGHTLVEQPRPSMPEATKRAILDHFEAVEFVDQGAADELFGVDALVDRGRGVLIAIGPLLDLADGVVGVEIGVLTARDGGRGQVWQFQWQNGEWSPATGDQTGVTVTSWIS